ncbi:sigma 54-interacting transcriptional regulator [Archangium primigenium]|uniref:sigma 54-interacting transcriptional regulator n=1 Tax=[Archangium] primigenium TaxID=2792470 RepID=UPI00195D0C6C|nr:sigma 54-interacting transcriptional regulator [Archangium primigenium]MBM7115740.1 sigma 54-interacting transcriptional regulator [Archangium primigenium]
MQPAPPPIHRRILLQLAGSQRNARGRKHRPGLELALRDVDGRGLFDDVVVLYKADDSAVERVARELVEDIQQERPRSRGKPLALGRGSAWTDPSRRSEAREPIRRFLETFLRQFGSRLATTEFVVSTVTGPPAQWTLLIEELEQEGVMASLVREGADGRFIVQRLQAPAGPAQGQHPEQQFRLLGHSPFAWNVLLTGPTGVGKSHAARRLHASWAKHLERQGEFRPINCAGIPADLLEAELFGHEKGSFTGATHTREGLFRSAHRGTVFLDEVGELPLALQAKLLTALELRNEGGLWVRHIRPVGGEKEHPVDVRVVLGTHRNLWEDAAAGRFRLDLLGRISTHAVALPALTGSRHRILGAYLDRLELMEQHVAHRAGGTVRFILHRDAIEALQHFAFSSESQWTWNFRDVEQSTERLALLAWSHRRGKTRRVGIGTDIVAQETHFLQERWGTIPPGKPAERSTWADLEEAMQAGAVESLSELERWEARWLLQARRATRNHAEAWRWIRERNLLPFQGEREKGNPTDSFKKRWTRYAEYWKETLR